MPTAAPEPTNWDAYWGGMIADGAIGDGHNIPPALLRPAPPPYTEMQLDALLDKVSGSWTDNKMMARLAEKGLLERNGHNQPTNLGLEVAFAHLVGDAAALPARPLAIGAAFWVAEVDLLAPSAGVVERHVTTRVAIRRSHVLLPYILYRDEQGGFWHDRRNGDEARLFPILHDSLLGTNETPPPWIRGTLTRSSPGRIAWGTTGRPAAEALLSALKATMAGLSAA